MGNLVKGKGLETLLKAFAYCKRRITDLKLWIVGDGYLRSTLGLMAKMLGVYNDIVFFGRLSHDKLRNIYNQATVTVLSSKKESFGLVLVESMACGTPVIATATEGARDIITYGVDGLLVPIGDAVKLADAICTIVSNPELREQMGKNARKKVERKFSWNIIKRQLNEVYTSLD